MIGNSIEREVPMYILHNSHLILPPRDWGKHYPTQKDAVQAWVNGGCVIPRQNGVSDSVWVERFSDGGERMVLGPIKLPDAFAGMSSTDACLAYMAGGRQNTHKSHWEAWLLLNT